MSDASADARTPETANPGDRAVFIPRLSDARTLAGDLRDAILARQRALQKPFSKLSEAEQRVEAETVGALAAGLVEEAVALIAGRGAPTISARVKRATTKKEIEIVLACARNHPDRHQLIDRVDENVVIVLMDATQFLDGAPPEIDKDQPDLDLAATPRRKVTGGPATSAAKAKARPVVDPSKIFGARKADAPQADEIPHDPATGEVLS